jgi:hypothetical protein
VSVSDLVDGTPPALAGHVCEAFVCQQFLVDGRLEDGANVIFLKFGGVWSRLYFDGMIFWRLCEKPPHPFEVPEKGWRYPHVDVGANADVIGRKLIRYEMSDEPMRVSFEFEGGKRIFVESRNDRGRCVVA